MCYLQRISMENPAFLNILMKQKRQLKSIHMNDGPQPKYKGTFFRCNIVLLLIFHNQKLLFKI